MKLASCLPRLPAILLALPLAASATIYRWTDERGTTVLSNKPPAAAAKVTNVEVVVEDDKPAAAPKPDNGNALQERVRALEQQVQALQSPAPDYHAPPYSPSAYPPPPMYGYGDPSYPYAYPSYPSYAYPPVLVVAPGRFVRPVHRFGAHRFGVRSLPGIHVMGVTHRR